MSSHKCKNSCCSRCVNRTKITQRAWWRTRTHWKTSSTRKTQTTCSNSLKSTTSSTGNYKSPQPSKSWTTCLKARSPSTRSKPTCYSLGDANQPSPVRTLPFVMCHRAMRSNPITGARLCRSRRSITCRIRIVLRRRGGDWPGRILMTGGRGSRWCSRPFYDFFC